MERPTPEEELKRLLLSSELDLLARLEQRLAELGDRVGDDDVLQETLRRVIVDVLRDAGAEEHERMSMVIAPLMLASLRAEIRNSRDMMVEALYPITGRLVTAAVKNAFRDMLQNLDTKVSETFSWSNLKLRIRAFVTRRPYGELVLQHAPLFRVDETLVIHRPTGLLIARAGPEDEEEEEVDRDLVGSMLNAVMSLTRDAFGDDDTGELSELEFGGSRLFVKSSPTLILVVVARGSPPAALAGQLDELFVSFLEQWGRPLSEFDGDLDVETEVGLISDVRHRVRDLAVQSHEGKETGSTRRAAVVLSIVALLLLGWAGSRWYTGYLVRSMETVATEVVARQIALAGYPVEVVWNEDRELLEVSGIAPDATTREALRVALAEELDSDFVFVVNALPDPIPPPDAIDELERFARRNAIYFVEGTTLRSPERADAVLRDLADQLLDTPDFVHLRVIGYVDPLGDAAVNERLSRERAAVAFDRLVDLGVPPSRLVTVGRPGERLATEAVGEGSESRRTEFEVYYTER